MLKNIILVAYMSHLLFIPLRNAFIPIFPQPAAISSRAQENWRIKGRARARTKRYQVERRHVRDHNRNKYQGQHKNVHQFIWITDEVEPACSCP